MDVLASIVVVGGLLHRSLTVLMHTFTYIHILFTHLNVNANASASANTGII